MTLRACGALRRSIDRVPQLWADTLDEHRRLVLGRILDAYTRLREGRDLDELTLGAVAAEAGIARSAIYNYVPDKHGLVLAHAERVFEASTTTVARAVARHRDPHAQLLAYVRATLASYREQPAAAEELMGRLTPDEQRLLLAMLAPLRDLLEAVVGQGVESGRFRGPAGDVVTVVWSCLAGYRVPVASGAVSPTLARRALATVLERGILVDADAPTG